MRVVKKHCIFLFLNILPPSMIFAFLPLLSDKPVLPYPSWYPFKLDDINARFYTAYAYEVISLIQGASFNASIDILILTLIGNINYQIRLLGMRLSNIGWSKNTEYHEDDKIELNREYYAKIVECVKLRNEINRYGFILTIVL